MNTETFIKFDTNSHHRFCGPQQIERDLNTLLGILKGITADVEINELEFTELVKWVKDAEHIFSRHPYSELIDCITKAIADKVLTIEETMDIIWICEQYLNKNTPYYSIITSGVQKLHGILRGIKADKLININEIEFLENWLIENNYLENTYPYEDLLRLIYKVIEDDIITTDEQKEVLDFCESILSNVTIENIKDSAYKVESEDEISIEALSFCITGVSPNYSRKEIAEMIEMYGGYMMDSISKKLNYLVICDEKSSCWAFVGYGRKVEKAMNLNKSGANIKVIHETCIYDTINKLNNR
jgi:NAD-dependent DNA ligase